MRLANPNNPSGASIDVQYFWQHDGKASAETVTSWGMIETQLKDIETKPGRAPHIEWKDGGESNVEKRESGFAYLIFTEFAIVPIDTTDETTAGADDKLRSKSTPTKAKAEHMCVPDIEDLAKTKQDGTSQCKYTLRAMRMQPQPHNDADEVVALSLDRARHGPQHPAAELDDRCPKVAAIAEVSSPDDFTFFLEHFTDTDCTFLEHFKDTDSYSNIIETMSNVLEQRLTEDGATIGMVHEHLELIYTPKPGYVELEQLKMPSLRRLMRGLLPEGDDKAARDFRRAGNGEEWEPEELAWYTIINGPNEGVYSCRIAPQARSPGDGHAVCDALYVLHIKPLVDGYSQARCYGYDAGIHTELAARRLLTLHERQRASFLDRAMFDAALDRKKALDERDEA